MLSGYQFILLHSLQNPKLNKKQLSQKTHLMINQKVVRKVIMIINLKRRNL